jgi:hypothetical protein
VLDGDRKLSDGVLATGSNFVIENFDIQHYIANGVVAQHARNVTFRNLKIDDTGLYGVYPVSCTGVRIERCVATGIADAARMSASLVTSWCGLGGLQQCHRHRIETPSTRCQKQQRSTTPAGFLVLSLPNNPSKAGRCIVRNNRVISNNHGTLRTRIRSWRTYASTGVMVMAADNTEVTGNGFGERLLRCAVFSLEVAFEGHRF